MLVIWAIIFPSQTPLFAVADLNCEDQKVPDIASILTGKNDHRHVSGVTAIKIAQFVLLD